MEKTFMVNPFPRMRMSNLGKPIVLMLVVFLLTSFITILSTMPVQAAPTWSIQTMDTNISVFGYCPIAVDSNYNPHIAFGV